MTRDEDRARLRMALAHAVKQGSQPFMGNLEKSRFLLDTNAAGFLQFLFMDLLATGESH